MTLNGHRNKYLKLGNAFKAGKDVTQIKMLYVTHADMKSNMLKSNRGSISIAVKYLRLILINRLL